LQPSSSCALIVFILTLVTGRIELRGDIVDICVSEELDHERVAVGNAVGSGVRDGDDAGLAGRFGGSEYGSE
jgi:hypothetical protein